MSKLFFQCIVGVGLSLVLLILLKQVSEVFIVIGVVGELGQELGIRMGGV